MTTLDVRTDVLIVGNEADGRKSYTTPQLSLLGSVGELTAGGSMGDQEFLTPKGLPWRRI